MWPFTLSGRLRIIALVGRYLTNQLMRRRSIHVHTRRCFNMRKMPPSYLSGFSYRFQQLSRAHGQVTYVLLTRSPLSLFGSKLPKDFVRLACIRHAASVHPEPGSNSPFDLALTHDLRLNFILVIVIPRILFSQIIDVSCSVFKDRNFYFVRRCFSSALVYNTTNKPLCQQLFSLFSLFYLLLFLLSRERFIYI